MIVRLIWKDCNFLNGNWEDKKVTSFWVEASKKEAYDKIYPLLSDENKESMESFIRCDYDPPIHPRLYFLVAYDLSSIYPSFFIYPYSGMWNGRCPFKSIKKIEIESLYQLTTMNIDKLQISEITEIPED